MDSTGLAMLIQLRLLANTTGATMTLVNVPDRVQRLLDITDLDFA